VNALQAVGRRPQDAHTRLAKCRLRKSSVELPTRSCGWLGQAGRKIEAGVEIDFPITRQDVAEMTGTTLHTVSRILSSWESKGLVEGGRQRTMIRDSHKLFMIAEGASD
jgi:CRP/FNR family transcriptional regulator, nitrogen oxide reductase regulator